MKDFNWACPCKKRKMIDVHVEGPITKKIVKKIKQDNPDCKIIINGKKY